MKKNIIVLLLALVAIGLMAYAGVLGIERNSSTGPFFIFLAACGATGLSLDFNRFLRERNKQNRTKRLGR